ncbi:PQQ-dependent sugar dehydrogenase [Niastella yeongjuensis]|nr:PQQ-dependent sugar dehydrogenase [Niastella yeongjuensis]SEO28872.1 Glucose/arabinose dehydrogenase, beta-propeller fold [Niastella yeongjuensis]
MRVNSSIVCRFFAASTFLALMLTGCKKHDNPIDHNNGEVDIRLIADNFVSPIGLVTPPDDTSRMFVIDQVGKIWVIKNGEKLAVPFMDVTSKLVPLDPGYDERGLLGLAFHPDYKNNGRFFVYYQLPPRAGGPQMGVNWDNLSRISEFKVSANADMADMNSEKVLLEMDDPQSNHNGGTLAFGPDGYLYISIGDGGAADDVAPGHVTDWYLPNAGGNGQDIDSNLFGNILRININNGSPYGIPADNPFVGKNGKDEIYAYGFRNPFRFSFDMGGDHKLLVGDAGQSLWEEVSVVTKGGNYGWNVKEGRHCFDAAVDTQVLGSCPMVDNLGNPLIDPVIEVNNAANPIGGRATTIIGGNVYRGKELKGWDGKYIFGTFSQGFTVGDGELFMSQTSGAATWNYDEINLKSHPDDTGYFLRGFGQDNQGEIYLTVSSMLGPSGTTGKVFKLVPVNNKNDW